MKLKGTKLQQFMEIEEALKSAIAIINDYCFRTRDKFDFDTPIPYGQGVDVFLLKAESLFVKAIPGKEVNFLKVDTVNDIYKKIDWARKQFLA